MKNESTKSEPTTEQSQQPSENLSLIVRRTIAATPARLFDAWTTPELLTQWWGPANVTCPAAEVDLRVGGQYRIANQMPDGSVL
jgi:uncharacterized protein YndB with AHSA1/START domain